ncbi:phosphatase PAP2 family protein [Aliinostoc sp. HNIBRCY26]|uniref:phosphatase PAP2 family protein n=1 Tax=Aliinostoc sp. HNIBRCY26 TaxID=3418997 RepID=UPI003D015F8B
MLESNRLTSILRKRLQTFTTFLKQLLITRWRSLLILFTGVYLPLQLFELIAVQVLVKKGGFPWDVPILLAIHQTAQPQLDTLAVVLTKLGSVWTIAPILTLVGIFLLFRKKWRSLTFLIITGLGNAIINHAAKVLLHRIRPHLWDSLAPEFSYAFPSGHAMSSLTLVAILLVLTWDTSWRWLTLFGGGLFILTIAWTRLYLGVHFPSDIIAGWMFATAWVVAVNLIIQPRFSR